MRVVAMDMPAFGRAARSRPSTTASRATPGSSVTSCACSRSSGSISLPTTSAERGRRPGPSTSPRCWPRSPWWPRRCCRNFNGTCGRACGRRRCGRALQLIASRPLIGAVMRWGNPRPLPKRFVDRITGHADLAQKLRILPLYRSARDPRTSFGPLAETLRSLNVPACVIWGRDDPYVSVRYAERTAALFAAAELHVIDGAGHWPFIDEPTRVAAIISEFWLGTPRRVRRSQAAIRCDEEAPVGDQPHLHAAQRPSAARDPRQPGRGPRRTRRLRGRRSRTPSHHRRHRAQRRSPLSLARLNRTASPTCR